MGCWLTRGQGGTKSGGWLAEGAGRRGARGHGIWGLAGGGGWLTGGTAFRGWLAGAGCLSDRGDSGSLALRAPTGIHRGISIQGGAPTLSKDPHLMCTVISSTWGGPVASWVYKYPTI